MGSAGIAQLVEQLICNQQVVGSNPTAGSSNLRFRSAFAEATADKLPIPDRLRLIANCAGEALEVDALEICGTEFCRAEIEFYFSDRAPELFREYFRVLEFRHDWETVVGADVHACVRGEPERNAMFHFRFGLLLAVDE